MDNLPVVDGPSTSPERVVERFIDDVLNGGRPEAASDLVDNDLLRRRAAALRRSFDDLRVRIVRVVSQDAMVAVHLVATGTHTGRFQGGEPTGRAWSSTATAIFEVRRGRIVDFWLTWDMLDILDQLGLIVWAAEPGP